MARLPQPQFTPADARALTPREARMVTVLMVGRILGPLGDGLCRIRNLSAGGLMAEVFAPFAVEDRIGIELRNGFMLDGEVRWTRQGQIGIRFDQPVADIKSFLAEQRAGLRRRDGYVGRAPRLLVDCSADIRIDGRHHHGVVADISQYGARLVTAAPLVRDGQLSLSVAGLPHLRGAVRWVAEDGAGITFLDPLGFKPLGEWLRDPALRYNRRQGA